ncbi:MAG: hypothetical protein FJ189_12280 [Gammaproteobacteria bacterium]|nr:hypothetical protein [Gammaproteobacteria bacterium]
MTRDIDLVVECATTHAADRVRMFGSDCHVSPEAVAEAIAGGGSTLFPFETEMVAHGRARLPFHPSGAP